MLYLRRCFTKILPLDNENFLRFILHFARLFVSLPTERDIDIRNKSFVFMTLIANWIGVDDNENGKLPSSLYLASDSRITFLNARNNPISTKDDVQKIFVSKKHPEMFAVCGDYNNCVSFIKHLIDEIDNDKLKLNIFPIEEKVNALKELFKAFSKDLRCDSVILYGTKVCSNLFLYRFELAVDKVDVTNVPLGEKSQVISRDGSGQNDFYDKWLKFNKNAQSFNEADTSRGAFRCIYEAIESKHSVNYR